MKLPRVRLILLAALATGAMACTALLGLRDDYVLGSAGGRDTDGADDGDAALESSTPPPEPIRGSVTVHVPWQDIPSARRWVLIGDGSKFPAKPVTGASLTFEDPALQGPQDISLVLRRKGGLGERMEITTLLSVARSDVWFGEWREPVPQGKVSGRVATEDGGPGAVLQNTTGFRLTPGYTQTQAGRFFSDVTGPNAGPFRIIAFENGESSLANRRLGQSELVTAVPDGSVDAGTIPLDVLVDRTSSIPVAGAQKYGANAMITTWLDYFPLPPPERPLLAEDSVVVRPAVGGTALIDAPWAILPAAYSTWSLYRRVHVEDDATTQTRYSELWLSKDVFANPFVFPDPPHLTKPSTDAGPIGRSDLSLAYADVPSGAQLMGFYLRADSSDPRLNTVIWNVIGPRGEGGRGAFTPFDVPQDIAPISLPAGKYEAHLIAFSSYDGVVAADLLGARPGTLTTFDLMRQARLRAEIAATVVRFDLR